ncbi:acyltransferase [Pseudomonas sp. D4-18]|uniref:acyltransferase family protein n=1 Tax=Pseudomonas sp. D4-18 TaxID=2817395 RepID=UPI003DAA2EE9
MLNNLQILRFVAAAMVVFAHGAIAPFGFPDALMKSGRFGVDIFFVISGFLMPYILFKGTHSEGSVIGLSGSKFFLRRVARIWPMYFIVTMLVIICALIVNSGYFSPSPDLAWAYRPLKLDTKLLLESLTFTHALIAPTLNVGWTLQFEFMFYTIIAILVGIGVKRIETLIISSTAAIILSILAKYSLLAPWLDWVAPIKLMAQPMMIEFLLGMILYRLHSSKVHLSKAASISILFLALPALIAIQMLNFFPKLSGQAFYQPVVWGGLAFLVVWSALSVEGIVSGDNLFVRLGNSSYCLYLIHWILMPWIAHFFKVFNLYEIGPALFFIVYFCVCQGAAMALYKYVETPINRKIKQHLK